MVAILSNSKNLQQTSVSTLNFFAFFIHTDERKHRWQTLLILIVDDAPLYISCILRAIFWYVFAATGFLISNILFVSVDFLRTTLNLQNVITYQKYAKVIKKENMKMHFVWMHYMPKILRKSFYCQCQTIYISNTFVIFRNWTL